MEEVHVHKVYQQISTKFNNTRFSHWNAVRVFLDNLPKYSIIADIGTGNGKYLSYRKDITMIGNDMCDSLLSIIKKNDNKLQIICANALHLPYKPSSFDAVISIAVFHHISLYDKRCMFIEEIIKVLKPKGKALITVWAREQPIKSSWKHLGNNDFLIPWIDVEKNKVYERYYHLFTKEELLEIVYNIKGKENVYVSSLEYERDNWYLNLEKITQ
jgi:tRNA (uracil-5-)-methyltransferase TRM9